MCRIANLLLSGGCVYFIPEEMPKLSDITIKKITAACQTRCRLATACHQVRRLTGACVLRPGLYNNGRRTVRCLLTDSDIRQQPGQRQSLRMNSTQRPTGNLAIDWWMVSYCAIHLLHRHGYLPYVKPCQQITYPESHASIVACDSG